jgi:hypothetical protein
MRERLREEKMTDKYERDYARVDGQPLIGTGELPQHPTEAVSTTAPENADLIHELRASRFFGCCMNGCKTNAPTCERCVFSERIIAKLAALPVSPSAQECAAKDVARAIREQVTDLRSHGGETR